MSHSTSVVAFVWSDDTSAAAVDALFGRRRSRSRRREPHFSAFIAARGPQSTPDATRGPRR